jgi:hypothetical protein
MGFSARLLLVMVGLLPLADAAGAERTQPLLARAEFDATGQATIIEWDASVPASLHEAGERALRRYPFSPARRAATSVTSGTWLTGQFVLREDGDEYVVSVREMSAGPRILRVVPPRWPVPHMQRASVVAEFVVGADGTLGELRVEMLEGPKVFAEAVREALADWRFEAERIDGAAVASPLCVPFRFTVGKTKATAADASACRLPREGVRAEAQSTLWQEIEVTARRKH